MGSDAGSTADPLSVSPPGPLPGDARTWHYFRAVYFLERLLEGRVRVGGKGPHRREGLRLKVSTSLGFPVSDLEQARWIEGPDGDRIELTTHFLGLVGATSPMPPTYSEEVLRHEESDPQLRDFLDLFHHRLLSLLYRSWLRHRHALAFEPDGGDPLSRALLELIDVTPETPAATIGTEPVRLLRYLGLLLLPSRPPGGLEALLSGELELSVVVEPLEPRWIELGPAQRYRVDRGRSGRRLGRNIVVGRRMQDPAGQVTLRVGPIDASRLEAMQPGGADFERLVALTRYYVRHPVDLCVRLLVPAAGMPRLRVGGPDRGRLRKTATVGHPTRDPVELLFRVPACTSDE